MSGLMLSTNRWGREPGVHETSRPRGVPSGDRAGQGPCEKSTQQRHLEATGGWVGPFTSAQSSCKPTLPWAHYLAGSPSAPQGSICWAFLTGLSLGSAWSALGPHRRCWASGALAPGPRGRTCTAGWCRPVGERRCCRRAGLAGLCLGQN
jgi:hypothetical protein